MCVVLISFCVVIVACVQLKCLFFFVFFSFNRLLSSFKFEKDYFFGLEAYKWHVCSFVVVVVYLLKWKLLKIGVQKKKPVEKNNMTMTMIITKVSCTKWYPDVLSNTACSSLALLPFNFFNCFIAAYVVINVRQHTINSNYYC